MERTPEPTPPPTRGPRRTLVRAIRTLLLGYVLWCGVLYFKQDSMLFLPHLAPASPEWAIPAHVERLWHVTPEGHRVEAWFMPALPTPTPAPDHAPPPLAVIFHGNAATIDDSAILAEDWRRRGFAVLLPEYRGYGRSGGRPSQRGIVDDAVAFLDLVASRPDVDPSRIVYFGHSLGGAVAAQVALQRPPAAIVFQSTFSSVTSFAWRYGVPPALVRHPFRTDRALARLDVPVLLLHGEDDRVVPASHSRRLAGIASPARAERALAIQPGDHNDFPRDASAYWREIDAFLARHRVRAGSTP